MAKKPERTKWKRPAIVNRSCSEAIPAPRSRKELKRRKQICSAKQSVRQLAGSDSPQVRGASAAKQTTPFAVGTLSVRNELPPRSDAVENGQIEIPAFEL